MNNYVDIKIKPDAEMRENVLLNKVYTKLHKALHDLKSTDIGISFPEVGKRLGKIIRIHGTADNLQKLQNLNWLGGLSGYCDVSELKQIPETGVSYRTVSRVQPLMTQAKLRRLIKRNSISDEKIKAYKAKMFSQSLDEPYLELFSSTSQKLHRRYIKHGELKNSPVKGKFDQFGLSKNATIPWF